MQKRAAGEKSPCSHDAVPYCREGRAAARRMQSAFLQWQKEMKQRKGEEGACACSEYESWYTRHMEEGSRRMTPQQKRDFEALAQRQNRVYSAWAKSHADTQEQAAALALQDSVLAENREILYENMLDDGISGQSLEQIMAAAREKARLQGLSPHEAEALEEQSVIEALYAVFVRGIEAGEFDAVAHGLQSHGMLLDVASRQTVEERLARGQEAVALSAQSEAEAALRREHIDARSEAWSRHYDAKVLQASSADDTDAYEVKNLALARQMLRKNATDAQAIEAKCQFYRSIIQLCADGEQYDPLEAIRRVHAFGGIDSAMRDAIIEAILANRVRVNASLVDKDKTILSLYERLLDTALSPVQAEELLAHVCCGNVCYATGAAFMEADKLLQKKHKVLLQKSFSSLKPVSESVSAAPESPAPSLLAALFVQELPLKEKSPAPESTQRRTPPLAQERVPVFIAQWSLYLQHCLEAIKEGDAGLVMKRLSLSYAQEVFGQR